MSTGMQGRVIGIASWVRRLAGTALSPVTLWHKVESEVADRLVLRCGKAMRAKRDLPFEFTASPLNSERCYWCQR